MATPNPDRGRRLLSIPARIALVYGIAGLLYITFSDLAISGIAPSREGLIQFGVLKGWIFIIVTALALYAVVKRYARALSGTRAELDHAQRLLNFMAAQAADHALIALDPEGRVMSWNEGAQRIFGYSAEEIVGQPHTRFYPEDRAAGEDPEGSLAQARRLGHWAETGRRARQDGSLFDAEVYVTALYDDDRRLQGYGKIVHDVTERVSAEKAVRENEARLRQLYDDNPSMYFTLELDGTVRSVNRFGAAQLGYQPEDLIGRSVLEIVHPEDGELALQGIRGTEARPHGLHGWELRKIRKDGAVLWVRETARSITADDGRTLALVVCEDISEARQLSEALRYQATHDPLTGLVNRREFERRVTRALEATHEEDTEHAICYLDLDQFKVVNDLCGHAAGDAMLMEVCRLLKTRVRSGDTLARVGGDEFALLMEGCPIAQARRVAEDIRAVLEGFRFPWEGQWFSTGASIGLVAITGDQPSVEALLAMADTACYAAKQSGRNRISVYDGEDTETQRHRGELEMVTRITEALDHDQLRLFAQPIRALDPAADRGLFMEILVRIGHPQHGMLSPGLFLPVAERYNLAHRIDRWVIGAALQWLREHPEVTAGLSKCSINLSGQSLGHEHLLQFIDDALSRTAVPPEKLCFEITETAAVSNMEVAVRFMEKLRARGCSFALDDFGAGLSSFAYLKNLPVDYLKIDGTFVKDMLVDQVDAAMVRSMNDIAQVMGKRTVAEFVENDEILAEVTAIGIDFAQGYGIAPPAPIETMAEHALAEAAR